MSRALRAPLTQGCQSARMANNIYRFRRLKWGDPTRLKVLVEDLSPRRRPVAFIASVCCVSIATFAAVFWLA